MKKFIFVVSLIITVAGLRVSASTLETSKEHLWAQAAGTMDGARVKSGGHYTIQPVLENGLMVLNRESKVIREQLDNGRTGCFDRDQSSPAYGSYPGYSNCADGYPKKIKEIQETTTYRVVDRAAYIGAQESEGKNKGMTLGAFAGLVSGGALDYFVLGFPWLVIFFPLIGLGLGANIGKIVGESSARNKPDVFTETSYRTEEAPLQQ